MMTAGTLLYSAALAVVPMVIALLLLRAVVRPRVGSTVVLGHGLWGLLGASLLSMVLVRVLLRDLGLEAPSAARTGVAVLLLAPAIEETAKAIGLLMLLFCGSGRWNTRQGALLGAAVGLGFAMAENQQYFLQAMESGAESLNIADRTLVVAVMHGACTAVVGAGISWGLQRRRPRWIGGLAGALGLIAAIKVHLLWNVAALAARDGEGAVLWIGRLLVWVVAVGVVVVSAALSESADDPPQVISAG